EENLPGLCLVALGGYGRGALFPHSDIDLLVLCESAVAEERYREATRAISLALWDLRLKLSPLNRTIVECHRVHGDNPEFNISLLDSRYLAGDVRLFAGLHDEIIPRLIAREGVALLNNLSDLNRKRHEKEGNTIFHLEPNIKNSPGGLRDYHVAYWVARLIKKTAAAPAEPDGLWPARQRQEIAQAFDFLAAARCFLHYRQQRDDNVLTYELQAEAAARGIGTDPMRAVEPAAWMQLYFRHARAIYALSTQLLDESLPEPSSLGGWFEKWKSRRSQSNFNVVNGRVSVRLPALLRDPVEMLGLFAFVAENEVTLTRESEHQVTEALQASASVSVPDLWKHLRPILL